MTYPKTNLFNISLILFLLLGELSIPHIAYNQPEEEKTVAITYITTSYKTAIFPAEYHVDNVSNRYTPSQNDVFLAERALSRDIKKYQSEIEKSSKDIDIRQNLLQFHRQYIGFKNEAGENILIINAFGNIPQDKIDQLDWLNQLITTKNKIKGMVVWSLYYNVSKDMLFDLNNQPKPEEDVAKLFESTSYTTALFPKEFSVGNLTNRFTLSEDDVFLGERALSRDLMMINRELKDQDDIVIHRNLMRYCRQYVGYKNDKGERILLIIAFWKVDDEALAKLDWLNQIVIGKQDGKPYWSALYNMDRKILFDLKVNERPF